MPRTEISPVDLSVAPFAAWDKKWFLLTAGENRPGGFNAMTVSWGGLGWLWGRPLAMVVVRPQRFTFEFIEKYETFTLSMFAEKYRAVLQMLGQKSGRDSNKMAESGLTPIASLKTACPGFAEAELILECRKSYWHDLDPTHFMAEYIAANYRNDYHRVYFGEVLAVTGQ